MINAKKVVKYMFDASLHYHDWQLQKCENNLQEINETIRDLKKDVIENTLYNCSVIALFSERREQQKIEAKKQVIKNNRRLIYEQLVFMEKEQTELQNLNSCHLE